MKLSYLKSDRESHELFAKIEKAFSHSILNRKEASLYSTAFLHFFEDVNKEIQCYFSTCPDNLLFPYHKDIPLAIFAEEIRLFATGNATLDTINSILTDEFIEKYNDRKEV